MEEINFDRVKFDAVWDRVSAEVPERAADYGVIMPMAAKPPSGAAVYGGKTDGAPAEAARLKSFMDTASEVARYCRRLAAKCPGKTGRALSCVAENESRHLKTLRAEYFAVTGSVYCPGETCPPICTVSEALRKIYRELSRCAEAYLTAAKTAEPELACTYNKFACDETREAATVIRLLEGLIC